MTDSQSSTPSLEQAKAAADARVAELEAENAALRAQVVTAGQKAEAGQPHEPKFRFTEDNAHELRTTGRTVSPFTGKRYVGSGIDDAREATAEEYLAAKPRPAGAAKSAAKGAVPRGGRGK